jgi:ADP-heptose:LPS heptosyltransferase
MGIGDEIMASGQAKALHQQNPWKKVAVQGRRGRVRHHFMWLHNPFIATPEEVEAGLEVQELVNGAGMRPYVDYTRTTPERWAYTNWKAAPGVVYLSEAERRWVGSAEGHLLIEPHIKTNASPNKRWGFERCQKLIDLLPGLPWAQMGPADTRWLRGARKLVTPHFRFAAAVVERSVGVVAPEGGLHHTAAAFGVPAVVIFGSMTSPENTGYGREHRHIDVYRPHGDGPCGARKACTECAQAMASITPYFIAERIEEMLSL